MSQRHNLLVFFKNFVNLLVETFCHLLNKWSLIDELFGEPRVFQLIEPFSVFLVDLGMETEILRQRVNLQAE